MGMRRSCASFLVLAVVADIPGRVPDWFDEVAAGTQS